MIPDSLRKYVYYEEPDIVLLHGDCLEILPMLEPNSVDLVLTDPPYSSGGFQEAGKSSGSIGTRGSETLALDNLSTRGYLRLMQRVLRYPRAEEYYIFTDWKMWINTYDSLEDGGVQVRNMLVWDKGQMGMGMPWRNQHELIAYGKRGKGEIRSGKYGNVLKHKRSGNKNHPTEKPTSLIVDLFKNSIDGVALDPFLGSGTTAVAAKQLGRKCIGIELEKKYLDIAIERLRQEVLL